MATQIFVNLPVKDLNKSISFFTKLGFTFNSQFTNDQGTCMIVANDIFVMLLVEPFFQSFTRKPICDATKSTEVLICLSAGSREEVDKMVSNAKVAGGTIPNEKQDQGWMYSHGFQDPDGHIWEVVHMDPTAAPQN